MKRMSSSVFALFSFLMFFAPFAYACNSAADNTYEWGDNTYRECTNYVVPSAVFDCIKRKDMLYNYNMDTNHNYTTKYNTGDDLNIRPLTIDSDDATR